MVTFPRFRAAKECRAVVVAAPCPFQWHKQMVKRDPNVLPQSLAPRGLSREQAAAYVGISPSLFDVLVKDGRMPKPMRINARTVWDRVRLDEAFAALSDEAGDGGNDPWSTVSI